MDAARGRQGAGLIVAGVTKFFGEGDARRTALQDVSVDVERGRFVSIVGPSGSGKSTLLRIVAGLVPLDAGSVSILGEGIEEARANKHIGYVPQSPALLPWRSVLENVELPFFVNAGRGGRTAMGRREARDAALETLAAVGLADVAGLAPAELSGGMQQRVAIARAFAFGPSVLLMDEPFSALDELTREQLRHELLALFDRRETTVLFVTHSIAEAVVLSDTVVVLASDPGRVVGRIEIPLPRPRPDLLEITGAFHELEDSIREVMRETWRGSTP